MKFAISQRTVTREQLQTFCNDIIESVSKLETDFGKKVDEINKEMQKLRETRDTIIQQLEAEMVDQEVGTSLHALIFAVADLQRVRAGPQGNRNKRA